MREMYRENLWDMVSKGELRNLQNWYHKTRNLDINQKDYDDYDGPSDDDEFMDLLHEAIRQNHPRILKFLLSKNVDWKRSYQSGHNLLGIAAVRGSAAMINLLIKAGIDVDYIERQDDMRTGNTALLFAIRYGDNDAIKSIQLLLKKGANPNAVDSNGNTPLHVLINRGQDKKELVTEVFNALIKHGAQVSHRQACAYTVTEMAKIRLNSLMQSLLEKDLILQGIKKESQLIKKKQRARF